MTALLSPEDLAEMLDVPVRTLQTWRYLGRGPAYVVVGKHVRYDPRDVATWQDENTIRPGAT
jgi:hypothetical protein